MAEIRTVAPGNQRPVRAAVSFGSLPRPTAAARTVSNDSANERLAAVLLRWLEQINAYPFLPPSCVKVALALALIMLDHRAAAAFPGTRALAGAAGMNKNTATDALAALVQAGFLLLRRRHGTSTIYVPTCPVEVSQFLGRVEHES
jgi:hypothetical protein